MKMPLRVLLAEDSEDDAILLLEEIRAGGFDPEFDRVQNPEDFIDRLERGSWDIILADYSMPRFNGLEALRLVQEWSLDIPLILVSGTVGEEVAVKAMKAGAQDYIMKDNLTRLVPAIEREVKDYRERRKAETHLKESEERFRMVFENAADGILIVDIESQRFFDVNAKFCRMLGYTRDELLKLGVDNIHPEGELPSVHEQFKNQVNRMIPLAREIPVIRKDGSVFFADFTAFPIVLSGRTYLAGFCRDITEAKKTKEELEKHHLHLEDLVLKRTERLDKMVTFMAGREVRMSELKKVIRKLRAQLSQAGIEPEANDPLLNN